MSTRGLVGFHLDGKDYVQYNHSDSYPTWLGKRIIAYASKADVAKLMKLVPKLVMVDEDKKPTAAQLKKLYPFIKEGDETLEQTVARITESNVGGHDCFTWYKALREYQGDLEAVEDGLSYWIDYDGFQWGFGCEWGYIINLDTQKLELYTGHWHAQGEKGSGPTCKPAGRYATKVMDGDRGILLIEAIPLSELKDISQVAVTRYCERLYAKF